MSDLEELLLNAVKQYDANGNDLTEDSWQWLKTTPELDLLRMQRVFLTFADEIAGRLGVLHAVGEARREGDLLTLAQAAGQLGVNPSTLRVAAARGTLTGIRYGHTWVLPQSEVDRYRRVSLGRPGRRKA